MCNASVSVCVCSCIYVFGCMCVSDGSGLTGSWRPAPGAGTAPSWTGHKARSSRGFQTSWWARQAQPHGAWCTGYIWSSCRSGVKWKGGGERGDKRDIDKHRESVRETAHSNYYYQSTTTTCSRANPQHNANCITPDPVDCRKWELALAFMTRHMMPLSF